MSVGKLIIQDARVIDPSVSLDTVTSVCVVDGRIASIGNIPDGFRADRTISAQGLVAAPGLIDLCARMREPGSEGALRVEMRAALAGGVTGVVCPPDTDPPLDEPGLVRMLRQRSRESAGARLYPTGALTVALNGQTLAELNTLAQVGCVAFAQTVALPSNNATLLQALRYAHTFGLPVWVRPVDASLAGDGIAADSTLASRLGLPGICVQAETVALHTIFELQRAVGGHVHLCRLSSAQGVDLLRAARREGLTVTADVASHHVHLTDDDIGAYDTNCRLDPPLRTRHDRDALRAAVLDGTIDAICSDHRPVSLDDKLLPFGEAKPGASGLETLLSLVLEWARQDGLGLLQALAPVTVAPARILGEDTGTLQVGRKADMVIFDPQATRTIRPELFRSSGRNTPLAGRELPGVVRYTLVGGEVRFEG